MGFGLFDEEGLTNVVSVNQYLSESLKRVSKGKSTAVQLGDAEKQKIEENELNSIFTAQKEVRYLIHMHVHV